MHYETLGVRSTANAAEIKSAYRRLARIYHPDSGTGSSAEQMGLINAAFDALKTVETRAEYDRWLAGAPEPAEDPAAETEPEAWGVEDGDWDDVAPGPRHLAHESEPAAAPERLVQPNGTSWGWGAIGALILTCALIALYAQFQENHLTAPHIRLLAPLVAFAALAQLFKPRFRFWLQAILCLGLFGGVLSIFGVWPLGPITGVGLLLLGPSVWLIRFGPSGWGKSAE